MVLPCAPTGGGGGKSLVLLRSQTMIHVSERAVWFHWSSAVLPCPFSHVEI